MRQGRKKAMIVSLDAGHGGRNTGATGNGIVEKDWTKPFCKKVKNLTDWSMWPIHSHCTRNGDEYLTLQERADFARMNRADIAISIHLNNSRLDHVSGLMAFFKTGDSVGKEVAKAIQYAAPAGLRRKGSMGTRATEDWKRVQNVMRPYDRPMVLIECGFISNEGDAELLKRSDIQESLCAAILCGITRARHLMS